ncbi:hypothetical protein PPYR_05375 [Photinus pyralis]|uniref:Uncharacterized protein n=2 Tax=Photinus pyralis TaxID=7054 RepID=A0A5N4AUJ9_PHOPY|nr:uncharacterized protein LOC116165958 [Photinus pyralis]XP_031336601.1 uncharacterized protein LOC116165958 [Photinus pyralis]XP_031336602.1 uncharacterized protein LOC116165958 [Photinus pyralis]KAB0801021.1 hypothetical protein PPYR_05375 [Photinus pyralis]
MASYFVDLLLVRILTEHFSMMKCRTRTVVVFLVLKFWTAELAPAITSRQFIPPLPGYIPVYIRSGNTPLEDINMELAEAFQSYALKQARINAMGTLSGIVDADDAITENHEIIPLNNINVEDEENSQSNIIPYSQHIQKIPRN